MSISKERLTELKEEAMHRYQARNHLLYDDSISHYWRDTTSALVELELFRKKYGIFKQDKGE